MSDSDGHQVGLVGKRVGHYEVQELIGTGGFASVYRAHDPRLRSDIALKVLADNHALNADVRERFVSEGHLLRRIENPAGLEVYDIGETDQGNPYLVLQLADRGDLESRVVALRATGWTPTADDVRAVVDALADALEAFHDHDVVHRDVKPSNVLISSSRRQVDRGDCTVVEPNERFLLADLGLAKDLAAASGLTVSGGSAGFAALEQMRPGSIVDHRADVFAASAVIAWLLSGRVPQPGSGWSSVIDSRFGALVPFLEQGLADDRDRRPATIRDWRDGVTTALEDVPAKATAPPAQPTAPPSKDQKPKREGARVVRAQVAAAILLFLFLIGALVGGTLLWLGSGPNVVMLDDGRAQVEAVEGEATVAIVGPRTVDVGTTARYEIQVSGVESWVVVGPDGVRHNNVRAIDVATASTGSAVVELVATTSDGAMVQTTLPIDVVEP